MNIHPTSIVSPGAKLGAGVSVGPYAVIEEDTEIGLRRAGFKSTGLDLLKEAYRRLLRSGLSLEDALGSLEDLDDPLVAQLIDFARNSSRGFCHEEREGLRPKGKELEAGIEN